jgi:hypothetical protein
LPGEFSKIIAAYPDYPLGKLIFASRFPEEYATAAKRAIESHNPLWIVEREIFSIIDHLKTYLSKHLPE